jgi:hypothetical protein
LAFPYATTLSSFSIDNIDEQAFPYATTLSSFSIDNIDEH